MAATPDLAPVTFEDPPVEEVVFAVQLTDPSFSLEGLAALGKALGDDFPVRQLQPPLARMPLPEDEANAHSFIFSLPSSVVLPRVWYSSSDGQRLVQAQEDRIAYNWRRLGGPTYPRYSSLRVEFAAYLETVGSVLEGMKDADVCELAYVNELRLDLDGASGFPPLERMVSRISESLREVSFLPQPHDQQWAGRWNITSPSSDLLGGLEAKVDPARSRYDGYPVYVLTMTARMRGAPIGSKELLETFDVAHDWIVRGFADLTTDEMHERWRRTR